MPLLVSFDVTPLLGQVAIVDALSTDFPEWGEDPWVAYRSPSAADPDSPPFPGVAVAAGGPPHDGGPVPVAVRLLRDERPTDRRLVHRTSLKVQGREVIVGNEMSQTRRVPCPRGVYPLEVWVDADRPEEVSAVDFVVWPTSQA